MLYGWDMMERKSWGWGCMLRSNAGKNGEMYVTGWDLKIEGAVVDDGFWSWEVWGGLLGSENGLFCG